MRINESNSSLPGAGIGGADRTQGTQGTSGVGPGGRRGGLERTGDGDQIQLSNLGQALQAEEPDSAERASRVAKLQSDVQSGRYEVDAEDLSRKLIDDAINGGLG